MLAYSYIRFSSTPQKRGDSIRRQEAARDAWLARHPDVTLDTTLKDEGVSALRGKHRTDKYALGQFLQRVEDGDVKRGSYLIVENLDRLSREDAWDGLELLSKLINKYGIKVVQLTPVEQVLEKGCNPMVLMMAIMELSRGHYESVRKGELIGGSWKEKKERRKVDMRPYTARVPAWIELKGAVRDEGRKVDYSKAEHVLRPGARKTLGRMFKLCIDGDGAKLIARKLNAEDGWKPPSGEWSHRYVHKVLTSEAVYGKCDGIAGFFPEVVSEETFLAAGARMRDRRLNSGRPGAKEFNPFQGLLHDALDECKLYVQRRDGKRWLVSRRASAGTAKWKKFPYDAFAEGILSELEELDMKDISPTTDVGPLEAAAIKLEIALAEATKRFRADPQSPAWSQQVTDLDKELRAVQKQIEAARVPPTKKADLAAKDPRKLNSVLRRLVARIDCVLVTTAEDRHCVAQVRFRGNDTYRVYRLRWVPSKGGCVPSKGAELEVVSNFNPAVIDLRNRDHALFVAGVLMGIA